MHIASVRLFLEVAEAGSLSKVAARRQTVQSHISRQITDFEAGFGGPLFRRTGRGVALTELGARVALRLRAWLQDTDRLTEELRAESGKLLGEVRLGIIPSAAHPLMTRLFEQLQMEHPGIRLNITEAQGAEGLHFVQRQPAVGRCDHITLVLTHHEYVYAHFHQCLCCICCKPAHGVDRPDKKR